MKLAEFYHCYDALLANWFRFSRRVQSEMESMRCDLHDDLARWQPGQPGPDLHAYAARVNAICSEEGLPAPFTSQLSH